MLPDPAPDPPAIALEAGGRQVTLKWHKLRRRREDPAFLRANLEAGLAAGAALEVDLVATADGDLVCLHERCLEHETTGCGPVVGQSSEAVLSLRQRDNAGRPLDSRVLSLGEIVEMLRACPPPGRPDGRIQVDLKEPLAGITPGVRRRFAATLGDLGGWFTLSGPSWPAVERLAATVPGLSTGFDPEDAIEAGMAPDQVPGYLLGTAPAARIFYLDHGVVLDCLARGRNPIAPLRAAGKRVDCWTLDADCDRVVEKLEALIAAGTDQITTNDPERLAQLWRERSGPLIHPLERPPMPFRLLFAENGYVHVCGHRGNSMHAPENTLPALESARRLGASTCEIDVVLSRDGEVVLSHDELLDRTTDGKGPIGEHDLAALKALDAGAWFAPEFAGTPIPTLAETIELAKALALGLVIEIKERRRPDEIMRRLREVLDATEAYEDVVLLSFDHRSMLLAKERIPGIRTEVITHARHVDIVAIARAARADSLSIELDMLHADDASALAEAGIGIRCHLPRPAWLARHEAYGMDPTAELVTALKNGAITSLSGDDVSFLRAFLEEHGLPAPPA